MSSKGPRSTNAIPRRSRAEIAAIRAGLYDILSEQHPATVRGVFYQAVTRGLIRKTESDYKKTVVRLLSVIVVVLCLLAPLVLFGCGPSQSTVAPELEVENVSIQNVPGGNLRVNWETNDLATLARDRAADLESARTVRALEPAVMVVGHGPALRDPIAALDGAIARSSRSLR